MKQTIALIALTLTLFSCDRKNEYDPNLLATDACSCFNDRTSGTIDSRLDTCLAKRINDQFSEIHKVYYIEEPVEIAMQKYMLDVTLSMVRNCDKFASEVDTMYTNFFPRLSNEAIKTDLFSIEDSLKITTLADADKVSLLNRRINLLMRARQFPKAKQDIEYLVKKYQRETENRFARAYIYRAEGKYEEAVNILNEAIEKDGKEDFKVFTELLRRKKNGR
jgi:tetratricopeptide (TPR) repeat protein